MVITIALPDLLETQLQRKAKGQCVSVEAVVLEIKSCLEMNAPESKPFIGGLE